MFFGEKWWIINVLCEKGFSSYIILLYSITGIAIALSTCNYLAANSWLIIELI